MKRSSQRYGFAERYWSARMEMASPSRIYSPSSSRQTCAELLDDFNQTLHRRGFEKVNPSIALLSLQNPRKASKTMPKIMGHTQYDYNGRRRPRKQEGEQERRWQLQKWQQKQEQEQTQEQKQEQAQQQQQQQQQQQKQKQKQKQKKKREQKQKQEQKRKREQEQEKQWFESAGLRRLEDSGSLLGELKRELDKTKSNAMVETSNQMRRDDQLDEVGRLWVHGARSGLRGDDYSFTSIVRRDVANLALQHKASKFDHGFGARRGFENRPTSAIHSRQEFRSRTKSSVRSASAKSRSVGARASASHLLSSSITPICSKSAKTPMSKAMNKHSSRSRYTHGHNHARGPRNRVSILTDLSPGWEIRLGLELDKNFEVTNIEVGSFAARAGIVSGLVLTKCDGHDVSSRTRFGRLRQDILDADSRCEVEVEFVRVRRKKLPLWRQNQQQQRQERQQTIPDASLYSVTFRTKIDRSKLQRSLTLAPFSPSVPAAARNGGRIPFACIVHAVKQCAGDDEAEVAINGINPGDLVTCINNESLENCSYPRVLLKLKRASLPLTLGLQGEVRSRGRPWEVHRQQRHERALPFSRTHAVPTTAEPALETVHVALIPTKRNFMQQELDKLRSVTRIQAQVRGWSSRNSFSFSTRKAAPGPIVSQSQSQFLERKKACKLRSQEDEEDITAVTFASTQIQAAVRGRQARTKCSILSDAALTPVLQADLDIERKRRQKLEQMLQQKAQHAETVRTQQIRLMRAQVILLEWFSIVKRHFFAVWHSHISWREWMMAKMEQYLKHIGFVRFSLRQQVWTKWCSLVISQRQQEQQQRQFQSQTIRFHQQQQQHKRLQKSVAMRTLANALRAWLIRMLGCYWRRWYFKTRSVEPAPATRQKYIRQQDSVPPVSVPEYSKVKAKFLEISQTKVGWITESEYQQLFVHLADLQAVDTRRFVQQQFARLLPDAQGRVSIVNYMRALHHKQSLNDDYKKQKAAFLEIASKEAKGTRRQSNRSCYINYAKHEALYREKGIDVEDPQIQEYMKWQFEKADVNKNGQITINEFMYVSGLLPCLLLDSAHDGYDMEPGAPSVR